MKPWLLLALVGAADSALVVIVDGIPADQLTKQVVQHAVDDVIPIVEAPEQWFWHSRRYRHRPTGEPQGADGLPPVVSMDADVPPMAASDRHRSPRQAD